MNLDKSYCKIVECRFSDIRHIFEEFHYKKGNMGGGISMCFAMWMGITTPSHETRHHIA